MDLHSKKIIGYSFLRTIDSNLTISTIRNALTLQRPTEQLVLYSNLGSQYTSSDFQKYISETKIITHSFSSKGCPYDNACIESFYASLKK